MIAWIKTLFQISFKHHFWGSLAIVIGVAAVISVQITDRTRFADSELHQDVMERWGTPIFQPAPSVRYVDSGSVFNMLHPLPLEGQTIVVDAAMNYRKRGLVYFSGFDFTFTGRYDVRNPHERDIDIVFVFPISVQTNRVLLSDLVFNVNGEPTGIDLADESDKLVWTGRVKAGEKLHYDITFRGRGLDSFTYVLDPDLRVKDFRLTFNVTGGDNYDYQPGVVPAHSSTVAGDTVSMLWEYASLESGVPVGLILPSEQSYDQIIATMVRRSWAPFILLFGGVVGLSLYKKRQLKIYESYLMAACYALFFVLLAYLAAFTNFYVAYIFTLFAIVALFYFYLRSILTRAVGVYGLWLSVAFLFIPTLAVILEGYTGLIYTLEIAVGLAVAMFVTTRAAFREILENLFPVAQPAGGDHVSA